MKRHPLMKGQGRRPVIESRGNRRLPMERFGMREGRKSVKREGALVITTVLSDRDHSARWTSGSRVVLHVWWYAATILIHNMTGWCLEEHFS